MYVLIVGYGNTYKKIVIYILIVLSIILGVLSIKALLSGVSNIEMNQYFEKYGSEQYGKTAYYIEKIKDSTMFIWIIGLWVAKYLKDKNIKLSKIIKILSMAILIITQLMPLGYVIFVSNGG